MTATWQDLADAHEHHLTTLLAFQQYVVNQPDPFVRVPLMPILTTWTRWVFDWVGGDDVTTEWTGPLDLLADMDQHRPFIKTTWKFAEMFVQTDIHLLKK